MTRAGIWRSSGLRRALGKRQTTATPFGPSLRHAVAALVLTTGLPACGPRAIVLPTDSGTPLSDYVAIHAQVSAACAGVRTLQAEMTLSGRVAGQRVRARVHAGFERSGSMRLEGVAPFGPPIFILAARSNAAVLLLPRESRVVLGAAPEAILGALTGVALAPDDLQAVLTGCVTADPRPVAGRVHRNDWVSIDLDDQSRLFLQRRRQAWEVRAARRNGWQIEYGAWTGLFPQTVTLRSTNDAPVDLTATLGQLQVNAGISAAAFEVAVPAGAVPLTLDELRAAGPLRDEGSR
jgi:hypothetical protein